jgi:DNA-binding beta-propeller fold protein YncE
MFQNTGISIDVTPDGSAVYVSVPRIGTVAVADVNTNTVTQLISLSDPGALAVVPDRDATLVPYVVDAADDRAVMTTAGGTAVANVRANDTLGGLAATAAHVVVSQLASTAESLTLDAETGQVNLAAGAEVGTHTLVYRLCEVPSVSNCDEATVTVNVRAESIVDAADDNATTFTGRTIMTSVLAKRHARWCAGSMVNRMAVPGIVHGLWTPAERCHRRHLRGRGRRSRPSDTDVSHL